MKPVRTVKIINPPTKKGFIETRDLNTIPKMLGEQQLKMFVNFRQINSWASKKKIYPIIFFLFIVFLFKLELSKLGIIAADPARDLATALGIVEGVKYPLAGPLLGGHLHSGPLYFYFLAIPLFISKKIISVLVFISLTQMVGIVYCYFWGKLFFSRKIGQILALLMCVDINSNFTIWQINNSDLIFPLGVAFNYHLSRAILKRESKQLLLSCLLLIIGVQFHPVFLVFMPFVIYAFTLPIGNRIRNLFLSLIVTVGVMAPWFYWQICDGVPALHEIINFLKNEVAGVIPVIETLKNIPELILKQLFWNPYVFWGLSQKMFFFLKYPALLLLLLISILALYGAVLGVIGGLKRKARRFLLIFAYIITLWLVIPFLRNYTAWYYFTPIQFMWMALAGYGLTNLVSKIKTLNQDHLQKAFLVGLVLVIGFSHYKIFKYFRDQGTFNVPRNFFLSIIDLRRPFVLGDNDIEFLSLGVPEEEQLAKWAAQTSGTERFHGAILYELSISRNSLYDMYYSRKKQGNDPENAYHYLGILKKDLTYASQKCPIIHEVGAMSIFRTTPNIDYSRIRMSYVEQEDWFSRSFNDSRWIPLILPVYTIHHAAEYPPPVNKYWSHSTIFVRMDIGSNLDSGPTLLGVGFPNYDPREDTERIEAIYVNEIQIKNYKKTGYGWIIPLTPYLKRGENNLLALKLKLNETSNLDVYSW